MRPFWMFAHNCLVHPLMGVIEVATWGLWMPTRLLALHDWTAQKAGFDEVEVEDMVDVPDDYHHPGIQ